jgi:hypothetical protein
MLSEAQWALPSEVLHAHASGTTRYLDLATW